MSQVIHASDLVIELWIDHKMEVVINLLNLCEVLVLHSATSLAFGAVLGGVWEKHLVDYNVVNVDLLLGELDSQALSLVHGEELGDAHGYESRLTRILELLVHVLNLCLHVIDAIEHALLDVLRALNASITLIHHLLHLAEHATKLILELDELDEALLQNVREVKQAERMSRWCCVENDQGEVVLVKGLDDFTEASSLINTRNRSHQVFHETHRLLCRLIVLALGHASLAEKTLEEAST